MEKRLILAIVLSIIIIVVYQALFIKNKPSSEVPPSPQAQIEKKTEERPQEKAQAVQPETAPLESEASAVPSPLEIRAEGEEKISVDTSLYRAVWSNKGAVLESWKVRKHKDEKNEDLELVPAGAAEIKIYPFSLRTDDAALDSLLNNALFKISGRNIIVRDGEKGALKFEYSDGKNIKLEKVLTFVGGQYVFDIQINLWKNGQKVEPHILWGPGIASPLVSAKQQQFGGGNGIAVLVANKVYRIAERKYRPEQNAFNFVDWAAYEDNYLTSLFLTPPQKGNVLFLREIKNNQAYYFLSVSSPEQAYVGPKEYDILRKMGHGTKKLINFGFFGGIAELLFISLKFIHNFIPNWGFAIIIITIIIKILFFPLTYSSTKSMAKMQEIQPKIKALRAKYKKAKQDIAQRRQMNEEMMRLYKEHGINPAGGCLPMLIQIPVFWGFFQMLRVAIELRRSPFIFWIKDLSVKDPYYVTPILMGVTQFITQKMTPTSADPAQAKMMLIMPVVMTFLFMNFQSGLVLYWLTSNVLQIGQQYIMNRMIHKSKRDSHGKRKK